MNGQEWPRSAPWWSLALLAIGAAAGYWIGAGLAIGRAAGAEAFGRQVEDYLRRAAP